MRSAQGEVDLAKAKLESRERYYQQQFAQEKTAAIDLLRKRKAELRAEIAAANSRAKEAEDLLNARETVASLDAGGRTPPMTTVTTPSPSAAEPGPTDITVAVAGAFLVGALLGKLM